MRTRFMRMVRVRVEDDCWEWTGLRDKDGYGLFRERYNNYRAHVASFLIFEKNLSVLPWPAHEAVGAPMVLHRCDRPWCVNPDHLYPGDAKQNSNDCVERGRTSRGRRQREIMEKCNPWMFKLTQEDVDNIRDRVARGEQQKDLAAEYRVGRPQIHRIVKMERWKP